MLRCSMEDDRIEHWRQLCAWLEARPYNASYNPSIEGAPYSYLLRKVPMVRYSTLEERRNFRRVVAERRAARLVYWAEGFGWRLRKDYRDKLQALSRHGEGGVDDGC